MVRARCGLAGFLSEGVTPPLIICICGGDDFMNRIKMAAVASCLSLASLSVFPAMADTWNKKTIITINEAVQVPGAILQPGKYVMKLMDSQSDRHIVQIFNEREDQLQTTILAIP